MPSTPLTIVLHGLVALVPTNHQGGTNHMTALLLNAPMLMTSTSCSAAHHPKLAFVVADTAQCGAAGCQVTAQKCECTGSLASKEIVLQILPAPAPKPLPILPVRPVSPLPGTPADANDFGYVANLSQPPINATFDARFLDPQPPSSLLARMGFDFESIAACGLFVREDEGLENVHSMTFRKLGRRGRPGELHQALAQMVVARLMVPADSAGQQSVILHLRDFADANGNAANGQPAGDRTFVLVPGDQGYRLDLTNDTDVLFPDDPCDDGTGRHFGHYYELTVNPPPEADRLLPHVKFTVSRPKATVIPQDPNQDPCSLPDFNLNNRPACPLASFNGVGQ